MRKRLISICTIAFSLCVICGCAQTAVDKLASKTENAETGHTEIESEVADTADEETESKETAIPVKEYSQSEEEAEAEKEAEEETLAYYFKCAWADSGWDTSNEDRIGMGIIQITIPDDKKREERINQMLVEESMKTSIWR